MWLTLVWIIRWLFVFVLIALLLRWRNKHSSFASKINKLPGPKPLPIIGNVLRVKLDSVWLFKHMLLDSQLFGKIYRVWVFSTAQIVVQGARYVERLLKDMTHHTKSKHYRFLYPWMGDGLLTSNDDKWRIHRKILTPAFHFNILHEFIPIFNKHARQLTKRLAQEENATSKKGFDIFRHTSLCSLDIICESSMGYSVHAQQNEAAPYVIAVNKMNDFLVRRYFNAWLRADFIFQFSSLKREMYKNLEYLNNFTDDVIAKRRQYLASIKHGKDKNDDNNGCIGQRRHLAFLDLLLAAEEDGEQFMTQKDIRDQVSTFLFEGHDTVSTATSWTLFLLGNYPEIQKRVVDELEEVFGDSGRVPEISDLTNLKYLELCVKETLRLYPPVSFFERNIKQEDNLEQYTIPNGTIASINIFMIHRDPEFWPDPEKFDPDRFLPENSQNRYPYAYIPFSAGPRNCIGQKFALLEEKAVLSTVLRHFRVEAAHSREEAELQIAIVLRPRNGLHVRMYERSDRPKLRISE